MVQPAHGFRYSAEVFWLVGFALEGGRPETAADLGTGSGVAALLLGARGVQVTGYDVRSEWEPLWRRSLEATRLGGRVQLEIHDIVEGVAGPVDLAVSNPPFFPAGSGPVALDPWRRAARTEGDATLADFVRAAIDALSPDGQACFVVPSPRKDDLVVAASVAGAHMVECVHIGRKRLVARLRPGSGPMALPGVIREDSERVERWYALARGDVRA